MKKKSLLVTIVLLGALGLTMGALAKEEDSDPCNFPASEIITVDSDYRRSTGYDRDDDPICDRYINEGWYRYTGKQGGDMVTASPGLGKCGTTFPIWLNGEIPTVEEGIVTIEACVQGLFPSQVCDHSYSIRVRNCGNYRLYYHTATEGCDEAYCIGTEVPCPDGTFSANGYTPNCVDDPCDLEESSIITVDSQYQRSAGYEETGPDKLCDRYRDEGWYRYKGLQGEDMVTASPGLGKCGTDFPIWLNGEIPSVEDGTVDRDACVPGLLSYQTCHHSYQIRVRNCGDYRLYYHIATEGCNEAYCIGTEIPCPANTYAPNGYTPDCRDVPVLDDDPWITWVVREVTISMGNAQARYKRALEKRQVDSITFRQVYMQCNVAYTGFDADVVLFNVDWYIEDMKVKELTGQSIEDFPAEMEESVWIDNDISLNKNVRCVVTPYYVADKLGDSMEDTYYVGFEVSGLEISIEEGGPAGAYTIHPTIPVTCPVGMEFCTLTLEVFTPRSGEDINKPAVCPSGEALEQTTFRLHQTQCSVDIPMTLDPTDDTFFHIEVQAAVDNVYDGTQKFQMAVNGPKYHQFSPIWNEIVLPVAVVFVNDKDLDIAGKTFKARNDPHMTTFDGRIYEMQLEGEFILYKHKKEPIQVQGYFAKCGGNANHYATCVCGVAIRSGTDLFIYDHCRQNAAQRVRMTQCDDMSMIIEQLNGHTYRITLPTGTKVVAARNSIEIFPSVRDFQNVEGLCGTFDNDCSNDFLSRDGVTYSSEKACNLRRFHPNDFSLSWRVGEDESLYEGELNDEESFEKHVYCSCPDPQEGSAVCNNIPDETGAIQHCVVKKKDKTTKFTKTCRARKKRAVSGDDVIEAVGKFQYDSDFRPQEASFTNGWTEESATVYATNYLTNRASVQQCIDQGVVDTETAIIDAVYDVQLSGDTAYASVQLEALVMECQTAVERNMSLYAVDSINAVVAPAILNQVCQSDCSDHGQCVQGECQCDAGFGGDDCSLDLTSPPALFDMEFQGLCDFQSGRPCVATPVYGDRFLESDGLKCQIQPIKINKDSSNVPLAPVVMQAEYDHLQRLMCPLPLVESSPDEEINAFAYKLSVTNDGNTYSNEKVVTVMDSRCLDCQSGDNSVCTLKADHCIIQQSCYASNESSPDNYCAVCIPEASTHSWTQVCAQSATLVAGGGISVGVMAGAVMGAMLLAMLVAFTVFMIWKKKHDSNKVQDSARDFVLKEPPTTGRMVEVSIA